MLDDVTWAIQSDEKLVQTISTFDAVTGLTGGAAGGGGRARGLRKRSVFIAGAMFEILTNCGRRFLSADQSDAESAGIFSRWTNRTPAQGRRGAGGHVRGAQHGPAARHRGFQEGQVQNLAGEGYTSVTLHEAPASTLPAGLHKCHSP
eukprot:719958-Pyramimonas_sp.AAC.1